MQSVHQEFTHLLSQLVTALHTRELAQRKQSELFVVGGQPVSGDDLAEADSLLPVLLWQAESLHQFCNKRGMGLVYRAKPAAYAGMEVDAERRTESNTEVILYTMEAFYDALENSPKVAHGRAQVADLTPLVERFMSAMAPENAELAPRVGGRGPVLE